MTTLHELAHQREALRERKRAIAAEEKELNRQIEGIDEQLFGILDEQGVDRISVDGISLSISETVVPQVEDWSAVYNMVQETGMFQLFERRISSAAYRELLATMEGASVPGITSFTKRAINMRVTR